VVTWRQYSRRCRRGRRSCKSIYRTSLHTTSLMYSKY